MPMIIAAAVAFIVTPFAIWFAPKIGAMDIPKDNRRVHSKAMPRFGGIALYAAIMVGLGVTSLDHRGILAAMVGCTLIYVTGMIDDLKNLRPLVKLICQIVSASVVFFMGLRIRFITNYFGPGNMNFLGHDSGVLEVIGLIVCYFVTVIWIVSITNAVNLIDGLDGLAAGIAGISAICIGYISYIHGQYVPCIGMMVIAGACIGFLPYNFNPAKIFMGDGGSQLLGFSIAVLSILGTVKSATVIVMVLPALVLGLPILDTVMAIVRRTMRGQSISTADKEHLHHRILKAGFGQRRAVLLMYSVSGIMGIMAILLSRNLYVECIGLAIIAIIIVGVILTDTGTNNVSLKGRRIIKEDLGERPSEREKE